MIILILIFTPIFLILRAYVSYYRAFELHNRPRILVNSITSFLLQVLNGLGYILWAFIGYKIKKWLGVPLLIILYYFWGLFWYQRGEKGREAHFYDVLSRDVRKWIKKGNNLYRNGYFQEANKAYDKALDLIPADPSNLYEKACIYALKKHKENTLKYLKDAITTSKFKEITMSLARNSKDFENFRFDEDF